MTTSGAAPLGFIRARSVRAPASDLTARAHWVVPSQVLCRHAGALWYGPMPWPRRNPIARVGLCEDDAAIRRVVTDALRIAGHEVTSAHDGGEALRLFT